MEKTKTTFCSTCTIIGNDMWGWYQSKFERLVPIHGSDGELVYTYPTVAEYSKISKRVCQALALFELKGQVMAPSTVDELAHWAGVYSNVRTTATELYLGGFHYGQLIISTYGGQWVIPSTVNGISYEYPNRDSRFEFPALLVKVSDHVFVDPFWCIYSETISYKDPLEKSPMDEWFTSIPYERATITTDAITKRKMAWLEKYTKQNNNTHEAGQ